jgi:predicted transcriptional regulator
MSVSMTLRVPDDLAAKIVETASSSGKSKAEVMVESMRSVLLPVASGGTPQTEKANRVP